MNGVKSNWCESVFQGSVLDMSFSMIWQLWKCRWVLKIGLLCCQQSPGNNTPLPIADIVQPGAWMLLSSFSNFCYSFLKLPAPLRKLRSYFRSRFVSVTPSMTWISLEANKCYHFTFPSKRHCVWPPNSNWQTTDLSRSVWIELTEDALSRARMKSGVIWR